MNKIMYMITILLPFIIISCETNLEEPQQQPPSFDELFYQNYRGISVDIFDSSGHDFCCNESSFFEIKKDSTFNLRINGKISGTNDSIDYQTSGEIKIWNKFYVPQNGLYYPYWSFQTEIKIRYNNHISFNYMNCRLYIPFGDDDINLYFENGLQININDKTYFLIINLFTRYQ